MKQNDSYCSPRVYGSDVYYGFGCDSICLSHMFCFKFFRIHVTSDSLNVFHYQRRNVILCFAYRYELDTKYASNSAVSRKLVFIYHLNQWIFVFQTDIFAM